MGQNLTHGVYLPDEGERNCYNGLAGNWQLLDGAVGTVAEHTTALAGKAPAVHTHTKSDVTDLFNSANVWSGDNTYSKALTVEKNSDTNSFFNAKHTTAELGSLPSSDQSITWAFKDKNNDNLCYARVYYETTGGNSFRIFVRNKYTSGAPSTSGTVDYTYFGLKINADKSKEGVLRATFRPYDNNTYDLGSSSYQWNNLYAKNYYYNGTAWGLDKANTWTAVNTFSGATTCILNFKFGTSGSYNDIRYYDSNDLNYACLRSKVNELTLGLKYSSASVWYNGASVTISNAGTVQIKSYDGTENWTVNFAPVGVYPTSDKALELGTSTHKWKTLNGINPGALSLPDVTDGDPISTVGWILTGARNNYTPTENGWFFIRVKGTASTKCSLNIHSGSYADNYPTWVSVNDPDISLSTSLVVPAQKAVNLYVYIVAAEIEQLIFFPCLGNV